MQGLTGTPKRAEAFSKRKNRSRWITKPHRRLKGIHKRRRRCYTHRRQFGSNRILAHFEAAALPGVWRLLYFARAASVSVTAARATLLIPMSHLLLGSYSGLDRLVNSLLIGYQSSYHFALAIEGDSLS